jgi:hypothetical protein
MLPTSLPVPARPHAGFVERGVWSVERHIYLFSFWSALTVRLFFLMQKIKK